MNAKVTTLTSKCWRRLINPRKRHGPFNVKCGSIPIGACIRRPGCVTAPALVTGNPTSPLHDTPTIRYTRLLQLTNLLIHDNAYRDVENASYAMIDGVRGETNLIIKSWRMVGMTCRKSQFSFHNFSVTRSCLYLPSIFRVTQYSFMLKTSMRVHRCNIKFYRLLYYIGTYFLVTLSHKHITSKLLI